MLLALEPSPPAGRCLALGRLLAAGMRLALGQSPAACTLPALGHCLTAGNLLRWGTILQHALRHAVTHPCWKPIIKGALRWGGACCGALACTGVLPAASVRNDIPRTGARLAVRLCAIVRKTGQHHSRFLVGAMACSGDHPCAGACSQLGAASIPQLTAGAPLRRG